MREIHIPFMRWHVRALGQVAQITQITLIDDLGVVGHFHTINFHGGAFIDEVKQRREGITKTHAATTPMTDVIDTFQFLVKCRFVPEFRVVLVQGVSGRRTEAAFSAVLSHGKVPDVVLGCGVSSYRPSPGAGDDRQG
jgi:hypothetical protein